MSELSLKSLPEAARIAEVPEHDAREWCTDNAVAVVAGRFVLTDDEVEEMRSDFAESDDDDDDADEEDDDEQREDAADSVDDEEDDDDDGEEDDDEDD